MEICFLLFFSHASSLVYVSYVWLSYLTNVGSHQICVALLFLICDMLWIVVPKINWYFHSMLFVNVSAADFVYIVNIVNIVNIVSTLSTLSSLSTLSTLSVNTVLTSFENFETSVFLRSNNIFIRHFWDPSQNCQHCKKCPHCQK